MSIPDKKTVIGQRLRFFRLFLSHATGMLSSELALDRWIYKSSGTTADDSW